MLIKEKLLGLKSPEFQDVFSSFLGTYLMDIISIESKLGNLAFCPVTSQNVQDAISPKPDTLET